MSRKYAEDPTQRTHPEHPTDPLRVPDDFASIDWDASVDRIEVWIHENKGQLGNANLEDMPVKGYQLPESWGDDLYNTRAWLSWGNGPSMGTLNARFR